MQILKIIALLIEYPDELLWENRDEALSLVEQDAPMLLPFAQQHLSAPLLDKQAEWCEVFERGRATSLLLFEHVHAESRDRGQAMVDLMSQYEKAGLELDCRELPDYLPLYLEYLSLVTDDEAREGLQNVAPIFRVHLVLGMTIFLIFPFTRLVHVWSAPFEYFTRRYQVVRSRR